MSQRSRIVGRFVLGLLCVAAVCSCRSTQRSSAPEPVAPGDERAVWEALLRQAYVSDETKVVVLDHVLESDAENSNWGPKPRGIPGDAWRAFLLAFRVGGSPPPDLNPGVPVAWFDSEDFHRLPDGGSVDGRWTAFHELYPGNSGHITLSRVGFSRDGRTAVVYGFVGRHSLMASGDFFVFRRTARGWRLVKTHNFVVA